MTSKFFKKTFQIFLLTFIFSYPSLAGEWDLTGYNIISITYYENSFPQVVTALYFKEKRSGDSLIISGTKRPTTNSPCFKAMIYLWCLSFEEGHPNATYFLVNKTYNYFDLDISPVKCRGTIGAAIKIEPCFIRIERRVGTRCLLVLGRLADGGGVSRKESSVIPCPTKMVTR